MTAATTLVEWAHTRRRRWTDESLPKPEVRKGREVQELREVLEVQEVPGVLEVPGIPEVPEVLEVLEGLEILPAPGVPEVWEVPGVLGLAQTPAPDALPSFENSEVLSLAADITPWHADATANVSDISASLDVAPRSKWTDVLSRVNWKSFVPRVKWPAMSRGRSTDAPERAGGFLSAAGAAARKTWTLIVSILERVRPLGEPSVRWLARGAALVSTTAVLMLLMVHRADLFSGFDGAALVSRFQQIDLSKIDLSSHLDRVKQKVTEATTPPAPPPPPPLPHGMGRLTISSSDDTPLVFVDGKPRGKAPVTVILVAGNHRLLLRSAKGSIEKTVRVDAGESSEMDESIFPGWVAVSAAVDLTLSENGRALKKDERGWAILAPGPHEIHLDNEPLGIHETRRVVVTPGDATRLSLAPQNSTLSISTNEPAEIWIDGTSVGEAPISDAPMTLGWHDVRVRSAAHEKWLRVRVTSRPAEMKVDLTAE
jgi:hypothetical protein